MQPLRVLGKVRQSKLALASPYAIILPFMTAERPTALPKYFNAILFREAGGKNRLVPGEPLKRYKDVQRRSSVLINADRTNHLFELFAPDQYSQSRYEHINEVLAQEHPMVAHLAQNLGYQRIDRVAKATLTFEPDEINNGVSVELRDQKNDLLYFLRVDQNGIFTGDIADNRNLFPVQDLNQRLQLMWALEWLRVDLDIHANQKRYKKLRGQVRDLVGTALGREESETVEQSTWDDLSNQVETILNPLYVEEADRKRREAFDESALEAYNIKAGVHGRALRVDEATRSDLEWTTSDLENLKNLFSAAGAKNQLDWFTYINNFLPSLQRVLDDQDPAKSRYELFLLACARGVLANLQNEMSLTESDDYFHELTDRVFKFFDEAEKVREERTGKFQPLLKLRTEVAERLHKLSDNAAV